MALLIKYICVAALLYVVCGRSPSKSLHSRSQSQDWWSVPDTLFHSRNQTMSLRRVTADDGKVHSCYEYKVVDPRSNTIAKQSTFCFPSIIIVGYKKCSTSALYALLASHPQATVKTSMKENCPFDGKRELDVYFDTLPQKVAKNHMVISGCIYLSKILDVVDVLRNPNSFYLVSVRNFADFLWSAYNYWCDPTFDNDCTSSHWIVPGVHVRSVEAFDKMVTDSVAHRKVEGPMLLSDSCTMGASMYSKFMETLWTKVAPENTMVLTSEELESAPHTVWSKISRQVGMDWKHPGMKDFQKVRYNTNENKGTHETLHAEEYTPGLYAASNYQPLRNSTRKMLDTCWKNDCQLVSALTGHQYEACSSNGRGYNSSGLSANMRRYLSTVGNSAYKETFYSRHKSK